MKFEFIFVLFVCMLGQLSLGEATAQDLEKKMLESINEARKNPKKFARQLKDNMQDYRDEFPDLAKAPFFASVDAAKAFLDELDSLKPLKKMELPDKGFQTMQYTNKPELFFANWLWLDNGKEGSHFENFKNLFSPNADKIGIRHAKVSNNSKYDIYVNIQDQFVYWLADEQTDGAWKVVKDTATRVPAKVAESFEKYKKHESYAKYTTADVDYDYDVVEIVAKANDGDLGNKILVYEAGDYSNGFAGVEGWSDFETKFKKIRDSTNKAKLVVVAATSPLTKDILVSGGSTATTTLSGKLFELGESELPAGDDYTTRERCPQYISHVNRDSGGNATSIDVVFQVVSADKIYWFNVGKDLKSKYKATFESEGLLMGFSRDSSANAFVLTGGRESDVMVKLFKHDGGEDSKPELVWSEKVNSPLDHGSSRLAISDDGKKLLAVFNLTPAHSHYVLLDSGRSNQKTKAHETQYHHNYDQRIIFDGNDFVIMEKRDHDVTLTLMKVSPDESSPESDGSWKEKVRSVYSTTNWGNFMHIELGNIVPTKYGYLTLFSSERDWDYKYDGAPYEWDKATSSNPIPSRNAAPRDLAAIHVIADFEKDKYANWKNGDSFSQAPPHVDNSQLVNSDGSDAQTITYRTKEDGWPWKTYAGGGELPNLKRLAVAQGKDEEDWNDTTRKLTTKGTKWLTKYGEDFGEKLAPRQKSFTTVEKPKLVEIDDETFIAVWEEHTCVNKTNGKFKMPNLKYKTTKAMKLEISGSNSKVTITPSPIKTLTEKPRLHWHDDPFEWDGKAAWFTGDSQKSELILHTIDKNRKHLQTSIQL